MMRNSNKKKASIVAGAVAGALRYAKKSMSNESMKMPAKKNVNKVVKDVQLLKNQVKTLNQASKNGRGTLVYHDLDGGKVLGSSHTNTQNAFCVQDCNMYETVLAQLRFFDPAVPGTLVNGSGASGTYSREYNFKTIHSAVEVRNNYQIPCQITAYVVGVKNDTNITPLSAYTDGLTDCGAPSSTSPAMHLIDSPEFNRLFKILKTSKKRLNPGQSMHISHTTKNVNYDPSVFDTHALAYQRPFRNTVIIVRLEGVIGHDPVVTTEQGLVATAVDIYERSKYVVEYEAGVDLLYYYVNNDLNGFTNGGVICNSPVADNQSYSQA